jgi:hypothetical protein
VFPVEKKQDPMPKNGYSVRYALLLSPLLFRRVALTNRLLKAKIDLIPRGFFGYFNLSKPCDACGHMVGGGVYWCPKCKICLCFQRHFELWDMQRKKDQKDFEQVCPMCGGQFQSP